MSRNASTLTEKRSQLRQEALRYCETADRNLKVALLEAEQRVNQAKQEFLRLETEASRLSNNFAVARLSKVMEFANLIVDQKSVEIKELKPVEVEALRRHFVPYVQQMKVIELRQKEFDLVKQRIDINAEVYMLYKQEVEASNQELLRD